MKPIPPLENYFKDFEKYIIVNKRMKEIINSLDGNYNKRKYCEQIKSSKNALEILKKQTEQLKIRFTYNLKYSLANLDKIDYAGIVRKIDANIEFHRKSVQTKASKNEKIKPRNSYEDCFTRSSIRAILTPMYS
jgi:hypothetical protein